MLTSSKSPESLSSTAKKSNSRNNIVNHNNYGNMTSAMEDAVNYRTKASLYMSMQKKRVTKLFNQ